MKPSSLSVKKLLRAIAAPVILASTLLSGSFASAETVYIAEGVDMEDYYGSERFNRCAKAAYMNYRTLQAEYERTGSLEFLGELAKYVVPNADGEIDLTDRDCTAELRDTDYMCWSHATSDVIQYWQTYYGVFYKGDKELPYGFNYDRETLKLTEGGSSSQVCTVFTDNWTNQGGNIVYAIPWYFDGGLPYGYPENISEWSQLEDYDTGGYSFGTSVSARTRYVSGSLSRAGLLETVASILGYKKTGDVWERSERGQIAYLSLTRTESGHAITLWGFSVDENGELESLIVSDNNRANYSTERLYLKLTSFDDGPERWYVYKDAECTTLYYSSRDYWLSGLTTIETPEILEQKYAAYHADDSVLVWNGMREDSSWSAASANEYTLDKLPTAANGWEIYAVDDYYYSYYQQGKNVLFDDTAASTDVLVNGTIDAGNWSINNSTKAYSFTADGSAVLTVGALTKSGTEKAALSGLTVSSEKTLSEDGSTVLTTGALTVSAGTLAVGGCTLTFDSGSVANSATLSITSATTLTVTNALTMATGSTLDFVLGTADSTALLTFSGTLTTGSLVSLTVDGDQAENGKVYHLISYTGTGISGADIFTCSQGLLTYADSTLSLVYYEGGYLVWDSGNGNWSAQQWESADLETNMAGLLFTGEGEGTTATISITGDVNPARMTADNAGTVVLDGSGRIIGTSALTMKGSGELRLNTANTYSGGTVIEAGKLSVGHAEALGTGKVSLKGGTLDMGNLAVANAVEVQGDAVLNGASDYRGGLSLMSGALTGEQINLAQTLELRSGSIANNLSGAAGVIKLGDGTATLSGNNTYSGTTTVSAGTMVLATADSLGSGDVVVNGGTLKAEQGMTIGSGQKLTLAGGALAGDVSLEGEMDVTTASGLSGSLTLSGGLVTFYNQVLSISGNLVVDAPSTFDVSCWKELGVHRIMTVGGVSGNLEDITLISNSRNTYSLIQNGANVMLGVAADPQTIYWTSGEGTWTVKGTDEWAAAPGEALVDPYFYNLDEVVFAQGGRVTIEGEVEPGRVMVSGDEALYLSGSGSVTGDGSLHKSGDGVLVMNAANSYSGGTIIDGGLVIAGGAGSFGNGDISLNGGELNLGGYAVENDITATGGMLSASAYRGKLVVNGHLQIGPETRAESIVLESGSIGGAAVMARMARMAAPAASIIDTPVEAVSGSIDVDLLGSTSLLVHKDAVVVSGDNSYTGGTVVQSGSLEVAAGSSLGSGPISLMGGILKAATGLSLLPGQQMTMNGGHVEGALRTSAGSVLAITPGSRISGDLTLGGGSICFNYGTSSWNATGLTIGGNLAVDEVTGIVVSGTYTQDSVLMSFDSLTGDMSKLVLLDEEGELSENLKLTREDNSIVLRDINSTTSGGGSQNWNYDPAVLNDMLAQASWGMFHGSHAFVNAMQGEKFSGSQVGTGATVWVAAMHAFASQDSKGTHAGSDISHTGGALGYEMLVGDASCIGMALGMMSGEVQTEGSTIEMNQDSTYIGLYGATRLHGTEKSAVTLSAYAAYGFYETSPAAQYANMDWSQNAVQLNVRVDGSRELGDSVWGNVFAGLEYFGTTDDTTEGIATGELMNMRAEVGAGVTYQTSKLVLHAEAAFLCDVARDNPTPTINGVSGSAANPGRVGASISGGAAYNILPSWSVSANANAEFVDGASSCSVNVGTAVRF